MTGLFLRVEEIFDSVQNKNRIMVNIDNLRGDNATDLEKKVLEILEPYLMDVIKGYLKNPTPVSHSEWPDSAQLRQEIAEVAGLVISEEGQNEKD